MVGLLDWLVTFLFANSYLFMIIIGVGVWFYFKRMWPMGLIAHEWRTDHWVIGSTTGMGARRVKKKDGTFQFQLRPYGKVKITPTSWDYVEVDKKGKAWLNLFLPNAYSFRPGKLNKIPNETVQNLVVNENENKDITTNENKKLTTNGNQIGAITLPKISFDTTDQHDIKDFMEDWHEKRERSMTGGFLAKYAIHILFLIQSVFIFVLLIMIVQGMPEMSNIWFQTAKLTKEATENLMKSISSMQGQLAPVTESKPPW